MTNLTSDKLRLGRGVSFSVLCGQQKHTHTANENSGRSWCERSSSNAVATADRLAEAQSVKVLVSNRPLCIVMLVSSIVKVNIVT